MVLRCTVLEMKTAPNSLINAYTMAKLIEVWNTVAEKVEMSLKLLPDEVIMWRLVYNLHNATAKEDEESDMVNAGFQPIITGQVSVITRDTLFPRRLCLYALRFDLCSAIASTSTKDFFAFEVDDVALKIVESFKA